MAGCLLGAGLWWVTRRLYGNLGGYTALALYCFSPVVLRACVQPNAEMLAALGVYGGAYTCIGVAHAMQGPRRKWRPRIVLLMAAFGLAAASHSAALLVVALLGLAAMLWVAEGRRRLVLPVVLIASAGALAFVFACYGFSLAAFSHYFHSSVGGLCLSLEPGRRFFSSLASVGVTLAAGAALLLYLGFDPDGAGSDRHAGEPAALGAALSADLHRRSLRRCLRRAAWATGTGRGGGHRAAASCLLCAEFAGVVVGAVLSKITVLVSWQYTGMRDPTLAT
jgi:hypothetical protein